MSTPTVKTVADHIAGIVASSLGVDIEDPKVQEIAGKVAAEQPWNLGKQPRLIGLVDRAEFAEILDVTVGSLATTATRDADFPKPYLSRVSLWTINDITAYRKTRARRIQRRPRNDTFGTAPKA